MDGENIEVTQVFRDKVTGAPVLVLRRNGEPWRILLLIEFEM